MSIQQIDESGWAAFFDVLNKILVGKRAEIEVASLDLGDQVEAEWLPLIGVTYDHKDDLVEVALEGLDHMIRKPREIYVDHNVGDLVAIYILDSDGAHQIIRLKGPLALPAPDETVRRVAARPT